MRNIFEQQVNNDIKEINSGQGDDCKNDRLLNYPHFKENYRPMALCLSKQQTQK